MIAGGAITLAGTILTVSIKTAESGRTKMSGARQTVARHRLSVANGNRMNILTRLVEFATTVSSNEGPYDNDKEPIGHCITCLCS